MGAKEKERTSGMAWGARLALSPSSLVKERNGSSVGNEAYVHHAWLKPIAPFRPLSTYMKISEPATLRCTRVVARHGRSDVFRKRSEPTTPPVHLMPCVESNLFVSHMVAKGIMREESLPAHVEGYLFSTDVTPIHPGIPKARFRSANDGMK